MKLRATCVLLLVLSTVATCLAQSKLVISFEGPWMFYLATDFGSSGKTVLVAIAPKVPGHYPPTFSTGHGGPFARGFYCLGFGDGKCNMNNNTKPNIGDFDPQFVTATKTNFVWKTAQNAYVIVLPVPDTYSSGGIDQVNFQDSFPQPSPSPTPISTGDQNHSLKVDFNYTSGPSVVQLLPCSAPDPANCSSPGIDQPNNAPVQITIKSTEMDDDPCDAHVHRAYHRMLKLLESLGGMTPPDKKYVGVPFYRQDCSPCDPQQDTLPVSCHEPPDIPDPVAAVSTQLTSLIRTLGQAKLSDAQKESVRLPELEKQAQSWNKFTPAMSELKNLQKLLVESKKGLKNLQPQEHKKDSKASFKLDPFIAALVSQEQALFKAAQKVETDSISGKDCRVTEMLVQ